MLKKERQIWIASSHFTENKDSLKKVLKFEPDGVVLKSVFYAGDKRCNRKCDSCPNSYKDNRFIYSPVNFTYYSFSRSANCEYLYSNEAADILIWLRKKYPNTLRIASIIGKNERDIFKIQNCLEENGAQIIEFNASKFLRKYLRKHKSLYHKKIILLADLLMEMKKRSSLPIFVKVSPDILSISLFKKLENKIDGITICNSYNLCVSDLKGDPQNFLKKFDAKRITVHGRPLWKYTKKYLPFAANYFKYVSASGGTYSQKKIEEVFNFGALSVQLCSGLVFNGLDFIKESKNISSQLEKNSNKFTIYED